MDTTSILIGIIGGIVAIEATILGFAFYFGKKMQILESLAEELKDHKEKIEALDSRMDKDESQLVEVQTKIGALLPSRTCKYKK